MIKLEIREWGVGMGRGKEILTAGFVPKDGVGFEYARYAIIF